jgi:drug/metabolite transporter (DMT)-like permease
MEQTAPPYGQHLGPLIKLFALFLVIGVVLFGGFAFMSAAGGPLGVLLVLGALFLWASAR